MRGSWRVLAAHRDLRLVLCAGVISRSGDWILLTGLLYRVYAMTGSTVATALAVLASFVPQIVLGPVAGVFADRWDRKRTMVVADLLLAAGLLPLLAVRGPGQVPVVFAVLFFEGSVEQFFSPAQQAMVPRLVPDEALVAANALSSQVSDVSRLAGSGLGGVIGATAGITGVALADAASFAVSAALLGFVRADGRVEHAERKTSAVLADLRDGLRLSARHRVLRALMIFCLITSVGEGIVSTLFAPFIRHVLHGSNQAFGLFMAAQAIGGIAGGLLAASLGHRLPPARLLSYGAIAFGLTDLGIFCYPLGYHALWPAIAGIVIAGLPGALTLAGLLTIFQRGTEDSFRGRVFGALAAVEGVAMLAGTLTAGFLTRPFGIIAVISIQGGGYLIAGLLMAAWLLKTPAKPPTGTAPAPAADTTADTTAAASAA